MPAAIMSVLTSVRVLRNSMSDPQMGTRGGLPGDGGLGGGGLGGGLGGDGGGGRGKLGGNGGGEGGGGEGGGNGGRKHAMRR